MSYYYKHDYNFSYHGLQRCKERLRLKDVEDFKVKEIVMTLIKQSTHSFETNNEIYIKAGKSHNYFIINKTSNLIITCTQVSIEKQFSLMNNEDKE